MIISKTPLRASLFGGGTDFEEYWRSAKYGYGTVLSAALDMHVYITVNRKFDDGIRIVCRESENVSSVDEVKHNIIREAMRMTGVEGGVEIIYMADLPLSGTGIGLASSSALAVGVLNALHAYKGEYVPPAALAGEACELEIGRLGQPIGIQDQYAVAHGGFNRYQFMRNGSVAVTPMLGRNLADTDLEGGLMMFFTGITRDSGTILSKQSASIEERRGSLDLLVEAADAIYGQIAHGDLSCIGPELDRTWQIKKQLAGGISNQEIDGMYAAAKDAGAVGGKILGAGGGGFLLLCVPSGDRESVRGALAGYKEVPFAIDGCGSRIVFSD